MSINHRSTKSKKIHSFPSFSFILSLSFFLRSFSRSLSFFVLSVSLSLSPSLSLSVSFLGCFLISSVLFICLFLIQFFVSYRFSYCGFLMFLWFSLHCILSVFSSLINFDFSFSFILLVPLFAFRFRWFSPRIVFSVFFLLSTFSCSVFGVFVSIFESILSPTHYIFLLLPIFLFLCFFIPQSIGFKILMLCEKFSLTYWTWFIFCWCVQSSFAKKFSETIACTPVITIEFSMRIIIFKNSW